MENIINIMKKKYLRVDEMCSSLKEGVQKALETQEYQEVWDTKISFRPIKIDIDRSLITIELETDENYKSVRNLSDTKLLSFLERLFKTNVPMFVKIFTWGELPKEHSIPYLNIYHDQRCFNKVLICASNINIWAIEKAAQETLRNLDYWKRQMPKDFTIKLCEEYLKQKLSLSAI
mgnify:CR=1 FL=1